MNIRVNIRPSMYTHTHTHQPTHTPLPTPTPTPSRFSLRVSLCECERERERFDCREGVERQRERSLEEIEAEGAASRGTCMFLKR